MITSASRETVKRTIWRVQNHANDAPFINKNVKHLLRLEGMLSIFPNAAFIIVERDLSEIAISLLDVRRELSDDLTQWFSIRPPSYQELVGLDPIEQIARQVVGLHHKMEQDLKRLQAQRIARLHYREFCREPEMLGDIIRSFYPQIVLSNPPQKNFAYHVRTPRNGDERALDARVQELARDRKGGTVDSR